MTSGGQPRLPDLVFRCPNEDIIRRRRTYPWSPEAELIVTIALQIALFVGGWWAGMVWHGYRVQAQLAQAKRETEAWKQVHDDDMRQATEHFDKRVDEILAELRRKK